MDNIIDKKLKEVLREFWKDMVILLMFCPKWLRKKKGKELYNKTINTIKNMTKEFNG